MSYVCDGFWECVVCNKENPNKTFICLKCKQERDNYIILCPICDYKDCCPVIEMPCDHFVTLKCYRFGHENAERILEHNEPYLNQDVKKIFKRKLEELGLND